MKVEITVEKITRVVKALEITETEFESLKMGESPFILGLINDGDFVGGDVETNFCINDMDGRTILDWNN